MPGSDHAQALLEKVRDKSAKIAVVGLGYVGLPTAVAFADRGFTVTGADLSEKKVLKINDGVSPIPDLDLGDRVAENVKAGRLAATTDVAAACQGADCVLLIVPTPVDETKRPDLSFVRSAAQAAASVLRPGQFIALESTTYPGTSEEVVQAVCEEVSGLKAGDDFGVAYCPERYNPGDPAHTLENIHRVVGAITPAWGQVAKELYGTLNHGQVSVMRDLKTAEAVKVIENIQRDLNIALANELALIFEMLDIDYYEVVEGAGTKWNYVKYYPGPGVGGHCLPVDPYYLTSLAERLGYHPEVILAGRSVNDGMPDHVVELLADGLNETGRAVKGTTVVLLGLSYKGNTGDARESPAVHVARRLTKKGADLRVVEPLIDSDEVERLVGMRPMTLDKALDGAQAVVLLVDHQMFKNLDLADVRNRMADDALFVETRNMYAPDALKKAGFVVRGVGRRRV